VTANEGILASLQGGVPIILNARSIGSGRVVSFVGTDPAPGVEWSETVPPGKIWRLITVAAIFTTDASVFTRNMSIAIAPPSSPTIYSALGGIQVANQTFLRIWGILGAAEGGFVINAMLPGNNIMGAGWVFRAITANLQPGDDWQAPNVWVEEWDVDD
jgi:hypothetical protein